MPSDRAAAGAEILEKLHAGFGNPHVLAPLAEIAPDVVMKGKTLAAWLAEVDTAGIERQPGGRDWWKT